MSEKILIVTNYYPPEKGAAANRIEQLALQLSKRNYDVSVLCPLGNYPEGRLFDQYKGKFSVEENLSGIQVNRLWIYPSNSKNVFKRILSILSFSTLLFLKLLLGRVPEKVVVQSPPLLLSFIALTALKIRRRKIILNISDLWPQAALELNVMKEGSVSHKLGLFFERSIYKNASVILGQSNEILSRVAQIAPSKKAHLYRNFPEHTHRFDFLASEPGTVKMFYAGLLGVAQGVLEVCQKIQLENTRIELHVFGDGAEKQEIQRLISDRPDSRIFFHGMIDRAELHQRLQGFDLALVPLKTRIFGSVPSKIFEYGALGMPILYFGGGEGEDIVSENKLGWVAPVGNFDALNRTLKEISGLSASDFDLKKKEVLKSATRAFSLKRQVDELIDENVF